MSVQKSDLPAHAARGYNRVPLSREVLADLDTPLSTYLKLADAPCSFLFESVHGGEKWGRYSIIGLPATTLLRIEGERATITRPGAAPEVVEAADPLGAVRRFQSRFRVPEIEGLPRFTGGLVGYFGYDTVRWIERRLGPNTRPDPVGAPDAMLMAAEEVLVFDNLSGRLHVIVHVDPADPDAWDRGQQRLDELIARLDRPLNARTAARDERPLAEADFVSNVVREDFEAAVEQAREYIRAGDIFQVVLSQRMSCPFEREPLLLYRSLRTLNPSPYMYFLNLGDFHIVGSSPEILVRLEDDVVTVRPIAGTRRRGRSEEEDRELERELLSDPKELAEHLMLLDLGRNDVGRVAAIGSVRLTERQIVERYSHVMHIVSNVTGTLRPGLDAIDVLRATFPAGTVSGAPKVRAMEIIDELEPEKRGVYSGAVGYIGWNGNMDTAIAIRTAVLAGGRLYIQAGAGIVADSVPALEWKETMNKGRAMFRAAAMATGGLDTGLSR